MIEMSATVTAGKGNERHNHDLEYRAKLDNVHNPNTANVIDLIPYVSYKEQINELMKPFIDEYNRRVDERYQAAWERFNSGLIKTKPRKRDYKKLDYDYWSDHINDKKLNPETKKEEIIPIFRSLIIGIGDKNDRDLMRLTEDQAKKILSNTVDEFQKSFPSFYVLGATMHLDEEGFYHVHLDYKPFYSKEIGSTGLLVGTGFDTAMEKMGYQPEQSIINGRDKVPLLFNAMRNKIYYILEEQMGKEQIRMQYNVSKTKDPTKDSSKNQRLRDWQETQDKVRELQHEKNKAIDIIEKDTASPEDVTVAITALENIDSTLKEVMESPKSRLDKNKVVVTFSLLDQLQSFIKLIREKFAYILNMLDIYKENYWKAQNELDNLTDYLEHCEVIPKIDYKIILKNHEKELSSANEKLARLEKFVLDNSNLTKKDLDAIKNNKRSIERGRER